jgi:hypothetical protein
MSDDKVKELAGRKDGGAFGRVFGGAFEICMESYLS